MLRAYKYRIYPTKSQETFFQKSFGCVRYIYNWGLSLKMEAYQKKEKLSCFDLMKELPVLKKQEEIKWLCEVQAQSLQISLRNLDNAYTKFFRDKKGFPKFKSKKGSRKSFQYPQNVKVNFEKSIVLLPKVGKVKCVFDREFEGKIKTTTVSQDPSGKYFVSILVDDGKELPELNSIEENKTIGIDTGIKTFVTTSNGKEFQNPHHLKKSLRKLKRAQRKHSKKQKGSKNREKSRIKLSKIHEKIRNQRADYIHKVTSELTSDNQVTSICIEDLNIAGMLKNHHLAQAISDVGLGNFYRILKYKCEWKGINLIKIGRWDASSKTCNTCGSLNKELTLKDREWTCKCGHHQDRDFGAAINIKNFGLLRSNSVGRESSDLKFVEKKSYRLKRRCSSVKQENLVIG